MSLYQEAAQLNDRAVTSLLEGNQTIAIESMAKAIRLMKARLAETNGPSLHSDGREAGMQNTCTVEIPRMESSDTIVFNQAIRIPADIEPGDFDANIYTGAVIFNLALVHHFNASGDTMCMAKAEKLYSMVLRILNDSALNVHTALVVKLACINNLSQIRYARGDYKNAREGLEEVSCFMRRSPNQAMFDEPKIQGLLMNVLLLKAPVVAAAA